MTNRDATREFDPKHRIIGAVIVVALAVILVPLLLGQRETPADTGASRAGPTEGNKVAITQVTPLVAAEPVRPVSPPTPASANAPPTPATPAAPVPATQASAAPMKVPTAAESKPGGAAGGWVVQVGTFANAVNANRLERKLRAEGQPVRVEQIKIDTGKAVRLRVGPFDEHAAALKAQERIQKDIGIKGVVLAYP